MAVDQTRQYEALPELPDGAHVEMGDRRLSHACLHPPADRDLPSRVGGALGDGVPLVPGLLALGQRDLDLGATVLEVERGGMTVRPFSLTRRSILSISSRLSSSLRLRRAAWLVQVPWAYSRMCTPVQPRLVVVDVDEPVDQGRADPAAATSPRCPGGPGRPRRCPRCGSRAAPSCSARRACALLLAGPSGHSQGRATWFRQSASTAGRFIGSTAVPFTRIVKCRWQPVDQPVEPVADRLALGDVVADVYGTTSRGLKTAVMFLPLIWPRLVEAVCRRRRTSSARSRCRSRWRASARHQERRVNCRRAGPSSGRSGARGSRTAGDVARHRTDEQPVGRAGVAALRAARGQGSSAA